MAATDKNMNFDVNLLPTTTNDHNLGSSSLKWNLFVNQINGSTPVTGIKGDAESNYRTGNVNLTPANIGAAANSHTHDPKDLNYGYLRTHGEYSKNIILPFIYNDIAYIKEKGGDYSIYVVSGTPDYTNITLSNTTPLENKDNIFIPKFTYASNINNNNTNPVVIDVTLDKTYNYTNYIYIDFGANNWRAKNISLYTRINEESNYVLVESVTEFENPAYYKKVETSSAGIKFFRLVLSNWQTSTDHRIAQVGFINYASEGLLNTAMGRGKDDPIWRSITPASTNTYSLGSNNFKWANVYATNFKGTADSATNLVSAPSLTTSGSTQITVTAGGKTSSAFTVPYATTSRKFTHYIGRPASANLQNVDYLSSFFTFLVSSSMTEGKPDTSGFITYYGWDNKGWASELFIPSSDNANDWNTRSIQYRAAYNTTSGDVHTSNWTNWRKVLDENNYSSIITGYKTTQSTVSTPSASGSGIEYISSFGQNANGEITNIVKSTVRSASETQSGVVTTGSQNFIGLKFFLSSPTSIVKGEGWAWYRFGQTAAISSRTKSSNNMYREYENKFSSNEIVSIRANLPYEYREYTTENGTDVASTTLKNRPSFTIRVFSVNETSTERTDFYEDYSTPQVDIGRTSSVGYSILTTKSAVTVAQGGTGATTAANARTNLGLGSMATETATNYVKIDGSNNMTGDLSFIAGDTDKFINFWYNTNKKAGASWRIGYKGTGIGDNNDFVIQSGGSSDQSTDTWKQHIQIKMETGIVKIHRGLEILGHIAGDSSSTSGHAAAGGGGYHNAYNNLILHGDSSTGSSGILFMSDKVDNDTAAVTNINAATDRAFIQYHANGITTAAGEGSNPTLATSGEVGRLIIGIGNDSNDQIWLQAPSHTGLIHQIGNASYVIPDTNNTSGSVGNTTLPVYVDGGIIKTCSEPLILYGTSSEAAATAAKTATISNFTLTSGVTVHIKFANINTAASPTLKIGSTSAVPITLPNGNITPWDAEEVVSLTYDGANWNINNYSKVEVIRL